MTFILALIPFLPLAGFLILLPVHLILQGREKLVRAGDRLVFHQPLHLGRVQAHQGNGELPVIAIRHDLVGHVRGEGHGLLDLLRAVLLPVLSDEEGLLPSDHHQEAVRVPIREIP